MTDFRTADNEIYCGVVEAHEAPRGYLPPLTCWRPRNGFTIFLRALLRRATTEWNPRNKGADLYAVRVLGIGQRWWATKNTSGVGPAPRDAVFRCVSRASGLTCVNRIGRGFWLGRKSGFSGL